MVDFCPKASLGWSMQVRCLVHGRRDLVLWKLCRLVPHERTAPGFLGPVPCDRPFSRVSPDEFCVRTSTVRVESGHVCSMPCVTDYFQF